MNGSETCINSKNEQALAFVKADMELRDSHMQGMCPTSWALEVSNLYIKIEKVK